MAQAPLLTVTCHGSFGAYRKDGQHRSTPITRSTRDLDTTSRARNGMSSRAPWSGLPPAARRPARIGGPRMAWKLRRRGLSAALTVAALGTATLLTTSTAALAAPNTPAQASGACASNGQGPRMGRFGGIVSAVNVQTGCQAVNGQALNTSAPTAGDTANGTPPLIWHGGAVMGTDLTGPLVVTPIFWNPAGHPMTADYKHIITKYLSDVARASGRTDNVFSTATEYSGTNGTIRYRFRLGTPIDDTHALPRDGCKLQHKDTSGIYADGSGYNACLDDAQVIAETDRVIDANGLPRNLSHNYVL